MAFKLGAFFIDPRAKQSVEQRYFKKLIPLRQYRELENTEFEIPTRGYGKIQNQVKARVFARFNPLTQSAGHCSFTQPTGEHREVNLRQCRTRRVSATKRHSRAAKVKK